MRKREKPVARWTGAISSWRLLWRATRSTEADHDLTRLMIAADEALYRAKAKGGDHVEPTLTLHVCRDRSRGCELTSCELTKSDIVLRASPRSAPKPKG